MVSAQARREQVRYAVGRGLSGRRACALMRVARSTLGYRSRMIERNAQLEPRLRAVVEQHPRYGYRRAWAVLRRESVINPKRVARLWRILGLSLPRRRPRKSIRRTSLRPGLTKCGRTTSSMTLAQMGRS